MKEKIKPFTRRDFIKTALISTAVLASPLGATASPRRKFNLNSKGLPTTILGKTGLRVPRIAIGCGSRFKSPTTDRTGPVFLENALDEGFYYWDCAANYGTEHRLGEVIKDRRSEIVVSSKVQERSVATARPLVERSFENLKTDYIDCYNLHAIASLEDAKNLEAVYGMLLEYKKAGDIGSIGISGHASAAGMKYAVENYDLDLMIISLDHHQGGSQAFEKSVIPAAAARGMGVSIIKAIRPRENDPSLSPQELIRYALSLEHVNTAIIGMGTASVMLDNADTLRTFTPMAEPELDEMALRLKPFFDGNQVPWRQPGYFDGEGGWIA
ncbi:MAG TPA: aldo/keto reductase [Oceanipulchritudo sp.]|nr:aldo/keto reductase [Oceanipulchritudo sp.]